MGGVSFEDLAFLFLLCAGVCEVPVFGLRRSVKSSYISIVHDRGTKEESLTRTDDDDRPWLLSSVSYYLVPRLSLVPLCLYFVILFKDNEREGSLSVQMIPEALRFSSSVIVVADNERTPRFLG